MEILSTQVREDQLIYLNKDVYFQMFCQCIWGISFLLEPIMLKIPLLS